MDKKILKNLPNKELTGTRAKTFKALISSAMQMLEQGWFPSITELAATTGVSRATAYRYFPTQSDLVAYVVDESLGPIQLWDPKEKTAKERISALLKFAYPQLETHEGALRAALQVSLQQWADIRAKKNVEEPLVRGNRKRLVALAAAPLKGKITDNQLERMMYAFSIIYGSEIFLVLKDIWGLERDGIEDVIQWMGRAIVRQVEEDNDLQELGD